MEISHFFIVSGALLFDPETFELPDKREKMVGSMMIFRAETIEEVRQIVESDVYYTAGVVGFPLSSRESFNKFMIM